MQALLSLLKDCCPYIDFNKTKNLMSGKIIDSVDLVTVIGEIESAFDIIIEATDIKSENFDSVEQIWALIQSRK